jgi:hypothetical protein
MKQLFFLLLFTCLGLKSFSVNTTLDIYYNTNMCRNCNLYLTYLKKLDLQIQKRFFISESSKDIIEELLSEYGLTSKEVTVSFIHADHFKLKQTDKQIESYCIVNKNNTKIDSFLLSELGKKIGFLNASNTSATADKLKWDSIIIPDSIKISDRIRIFNHNNIINISDYLLNRNTSLFLDPPSNKIVKSIIIKSNEFNPSLFLRTNCTDTVMYKAMFGLLKAIGFDKPKIESAFVNDTSISLFIGFPCPLAIKNTSDTDIINRVFFYNINYKTNRSSLNWVVDDGLIPMLEKEYIVNNLFPFYLNKESFYYSVSSEMNNMDKNFISKYIKKGDKIYFEKILRSKIDTWEPIKNFENSNKSTNSHFYFMNSYPYFYDYTKDEEFAIQPSLLNPDKQNIFINDIIRNGNQIKIIILLNQVPYLFVLDSQTKKILEKSKIDSKNKNVDYLRFYNSNEYFLIDKKTIYRFKLS